MPFEYKLKSADGQDFTINSVDRLTPTEQAVAAFKFTAKERDDARAAMQPGFADTINNALTTARGAVGQGLNYVDSLGGRMPPRTDIYGNPVAGGYGGMVPTDSLNPVPGNLGDAAALAGSGAAGIMTRGAAGFRPAVTRVLTPTITGAAGDQATGNPMTPADALMRILATGGAELGAGVAGFVKKFRGTGLDAQDRERIAAAANASAGPGVTPVVGTNRGILQAGAGKPSMGEPTASGSLEALLDARFKATKDTAVQIVDSLPLPNKTLTVGGYTGVQPGKPLTFDVGGKQVSLESALDTYAGLRADAARGGEAVAGRGDLRAEASKLYDQILTKLNGTGMPEHRLVAATLASARPELASGMSGQRLLDSPASGTSIAGKALEPILQPNGRPDMPAMQRRYLAMKEAGMIDPAVQPAIEKQLWRDSYPGAPGQPLTDIPGVLPFKKLRVRAGPTGGVSGAENVGDFVSMWGQMPQYVGTREALRPVGPIEGLPRTLINLGSLLGAQGLRQLMNSR